MRTHKILESFSDWRGAMVRLDCGHILHEAIKNAKQRRCIECDKRSRCEPYAPAYVPALHDIRCGCGPCNGRTDL